MITKLCRHVTYKNHDSMSKVRVTLRGQRCVIYALFRPELQGHIYRSIMKTGNIYLVRVITSQVLVVSLYYLVKICTMLSRCVADIHVYEGRSLSSRTTFIDDLWLIIFCISTLNLLEVFFFFN